MLLRNCLQVIFIPLLNITGLSKEWITGKDVINSLIICFVE
uniref:Uncharacterized protein n=1 Tax=Octopus bimaculoides TaxID=37653 RepID=A0A0L8FY54_OCTBM